MIRPLTSTYLTFSPDGGDLIVNLGSDQIYIYDKYALFDEQLPSRWEQLAVMEKTCDKIPETVRNGSCRGPVQPSTGPLPERAEQIKLAANAEFEGGNYSAAIGLYNRALSSCSHPTLYGNRAAALMKRAWTGDIYAALGDCLAALAAEPRHVKAGQESIFW
jgi:WD and tetratricopeptide repeat-containing protein 1